MRKLTATEFIGIRFGRMLPQRFIGGVPPMIECLCDCGITKTVCAKHLRSGGVKSCGCLRRDTYLENFTIHGHAAIGMGVSKAYTAWRGMINRCHNPNNPSFADYGGRGVAVCDEWRRDFMAFYKHIGDCHNKHNTIDRIKNMVGYQPGNVRWSTPKEQARNRRNNVYLTINGEKMLLIEAAEKYGIKHSTIRNRITDGWSENDAVLIPVAPRGFDQ